MLKILAPLALALTFALSGCVPSDVAPVPAPLPAPGLVIFEDGSGRDDTGHVYPEDTFEWDCETMGNKICGPAADAAPAPAPAPLPEPEPAAAPEPLPMDITVFEDGSALEIDGTSHPAGTFDYASVPAASRYTPCP